MPSYLTLGGGAFSKPLSARQIPEEIEGLVKILKQHVISVQLEKVREGSGVENRVH